MVSNVWQLFCCGVSRADSTTGTGPPGRPITLDTGESLITPVGVSQEGLKSTAFEDRSPFEDAFGRGQGTSIRSDPLATRSSVRCSAESAPAAQALPQAGLGVGTSASESERRSLRQCEPNSGRIVLLTRHDDGTGTSDNKNANRNGGQASPLERCVHMYGHLSHLRPPSANAAPMGATGDGFAVQAVRPGENSTQLSSSLSDPLATSSPDMEVVRQSGSPTTHQGGSPTTHQAAATDAAPSAATNPPAPTVPSRHAPSALDRNASPPATGTRFAAAAAAAAAAAVGAAGASVPEAPPAAGVAAGNSAANSVQSSPSEGPARLGLGLGAGAGGINGGSRKHVSGVSRLCDAWLPHLPQGPQKSLPAGAPGDQVQPPQQVHPDPQPQAKPQQQTAAQGASSTTGAGVAVRQLPPHVPHQHQQSRLAPTAVAPAGAAGSTAVRQAQPTRISGGNIKHPHQYQQQQDLSGSLPLPQALCTGSIGRLPRSGAHDASQVALLQMLHFGSLSGRVPLNHLATLNVACLSREIRALHWIGQGGGGAVFQGVWQGAPVAVKFMLAARPEHVDATALEAIVSVAVGHPNVVTTYCFDVTRLTEKSFAEVEQQHQQTMAMLHTPNAFNGDESSATALYNALMESNLSVEPSHLHPTRSRQYGGVPSASASRNTLTALPGAPAAAGAGPAAGAVGAVGAVGGTQPGTSSRSAVCRVESLNMRVRRAQAAAAAASGSAAMTPTAAEQQEGIVCAAASGNDSSGNGNSPSPSSLQQQPPQPQQQQQQQQAVQARQQQQQQRQQQQQQAGAQRLVPQASYEAGGCLESVFNSEEGFGEPDLADNQQAWTVRHVLTYLKARPGMYMTHIIMEYCDRGSLQSAIQRGIFRMDALPDEVSVGSVSGASASVEGSCKSATTAAAAAADTPRFTRRVVLRALLRTARDVAQGMSHLHANNIIHGDLKPGNVLLRGCRTDRRGFTALVSDFGLSKITRGDKPLELNHWSTVTVMAPEVIMGRWLKASDVFSFGILLWQLVTGEMMPYGKSTVQQVLLGVSQGTLKPVWPSWAHGPLVRLGRACLATSPETRPSFEAIVKILTKIEQNVRNELRLQKSAAGGADWGDYSHTGSSRHGRSSSSSNNMTQLNRFRLSDV